MTESLKLKRFNKISQKVKVYEINTNFSVSVDAHV